ncbi:MAG: hypothetical protein MJE77_23235 [Proteobacteria bacterium]|nr:hypothetical protein [Pseudomonadota bacterium]
MSAATHQGELKATRTLWRWLTRKGWVLSNPWVEVELVGEVRRGKEQLRRGELAKLAVLCFRTARESASNGRWVGHDVDRALAVLVSLYPGMRASEVVSLCGRDINGDVITYTPAKQRGQRKVKRVKITTELSSLFQAKAKGAERLFPYKPPWVRSSLMRLCKEAEGSRLLRPRE